VNKGVFRKQKTHQLIICPLLIIYAKKKERKIDTKKNMSVFFFYFKEFFVCSQIGDHPHKDVKKKK
jgi:hypothetical protein